MDYDYWITLAESIVLSPIAFAIAYHAYQNPIEGQMLQRNLVILFFGGVGAIGVLFILENLYKAALKIFG